MPVFVTVSGVLANREAKGGELRGKRPKCWENVPVIPRSPATSQPLMNWPTIARTSLGPKGRSNGVGMAVPLLNMFSMVLWRDSIVAMEAASVRMCESPMRCAAPRYAPTPVCSTTPAVEISVDTSVRAFEKSTVQPSIGVTPFCLRRVWGPCQKVKKEEEEGIHTWRVVSWVLSSDWMVVIC